MQTTCTHFNYYPICHRKQFYETYSNDTKLSSLVIEISWTHNLLIMSKTTNNQEREFYLRLAIQEKYSSRELERQIDSGMFERFITNNQFLSAVLRELHPTAETNIFL
jgi:predicted nuclease of restriction endonuclease-like (RecB) superfamily